MYSPFQNHRSILSRTKPRKRRQPGELSMSTSREEALFRGESRYLGDPCKASEGHERVRYARTGQCCACARDRVYKKRRLDRAHRYEERVKVTERRRAIEERQADRVDEYYGDWKQ